MLSSIYFKRQSKLINLCQENWGKIMLSFKKHLLGSITETLTIAFAGFYGDVRTKGDIVGFLNGIFDSTESGVQPVQITRVNFFR